MQGKRVRIGGASGFWGDSAVAAPQLVQRGQIDYLVFDYLAELTMSILAGARLKNPQLGYATDFVNVAMKSVLPQLVEKKIRVVSNAGGVHPEACAQALQALAQSMNLPLKVAVVLGDDLMPHEAELRQLPLAELQSGAPLPARLVSANAYLGAGPIAKALDGGADVVITGRCVDSAVTLGILVHEFGWRLDGEHDLDRLSQGSLAGHLIECGAQGTGGLFTDWQNVPDWAHIGYPVIECEADGRFLLTKPPGTGGLVSPATASEQLVYEIGDPARYLLPDVVCDWTQVRIQAVDDVTVQVWGGTGRAPTDSYKVCATYLQGYRCSGQLTIVGQDAAAKAQRTGEALIERTREMVVSLGWGDYSAVAIEVLGAESAYGPLARPGARATREAVLRLTVTHANKAALELFAREIAPAGTSFSPGTTGAGGGRPSVSPSIRQYAFLLPKSHVQARVIQADGHEVAVQGAAPAPAAVADPSAARASTTDRAAADASWLPQAAAVNTAAVEGDPSAWVQVPLVSLAYARSGDKGDISNIGVIARHPDYLPYLQGQLTAHAVAQWLSHAIKGRVTRYHLPGIQAMNFVCEQALDGGGMASLRNDALGKGMAQMLLDCPVKLPAPLAQGLPRI